MAGRPRGDDAIVAELFLPTRRLPARAHASASLDSKEARPPPAWPRRAAPLGVRAIGDSRMSVSHRAATTCTRHEPWRACAPGFRESSLSALCPPTRRGQATTTRARARPLQPLLEARANEAFRRRGDRRRGPEARPRRSLSRARGSGRRDRETAFPRPQGVRRVSSRTRPGRLLRGGGGGGGGGGGDGWRGARDSSRSRALRCHTVRSYDGEDVVTRADAGAGGTPTNGGAPIGASTSTRRARGGRAHRAAGAADVDGRGVPPTRAANVLFFLFFFFVSGPRASRGKRGSRREIRAAS